VVASPEELNQWLPRTSGEAVHVASPGSDLLKDLRASVAVQKAAKDFSRGRNSERVQRPVVKAPKNEGQPGFKTEIFLTESKQTGPNTFDVWYRVPDSQASGDYPLKQG
jgi:hypothetical protein